jgi:hypothetical protein
MMRLSSAPWLSRVAALRRWLRVAQALLIIPQRVALVAAGLAVLLAGQVQPLEQQILVVAVVVMEDKLTVPQAEVVL